MGDVRPAGPWRTVKVDGMDVPYYVISFDARGFCTAPATQRHLLDAVRNGRATDVYVFSHGWNNDWAVVGTGGLYERFISTFLELVEEFGPPRPGSKPVLVGLSWPSLLLTSNTGPQMAATGPADEQAEARGAAEAAALADEVVADTDRAHFYELISRTSLADDEARSLADLLLPLYQREEEELAGSEPREVEAGVAPGPGDARDLVALWHKLAAAESVDAEHTVVEGLPPDSDADKRNGAGSGGPAQPGTAGLFDLLDPRAIVRGASVLLMKDRAGRVGANGVKDLVQALQEQADGLRMHLVGHSYGCRVVLSAVAAAQAPRPVRSILLLQPALSYLAFADRVPGTDRPGGYRPVLARCELPIMVTFSRRDVALRRLFHLGVRRASDVGEQQIGVAARDLPRSRFAALGGYGPAGLLAGEVHDEQMREPEDGPYELPEPPAEMLALEAHETIRGHGDVANRATAWALYGLVAATGSDQGAMGPGGGDG